MKTLITLLLTIVLSLSTAIAQEFNGIATYKTDRSFDIPENDAKESGIDDAMMEQLRAQMKKQFQKTYTLNFTTTESLYEQEQSLAPPAVGDGIQIIVSGGNDLVYRNTKEKTYTQATEIMGKEFLIQDALVDQEWKLEKETKNIGEYVCFKATKTKTRNDRIYNEEKQEYEDSEKVILLTVWYTPSIPVQHGPDDYYGLPGLVLEVNDGDLTILCSKIVLNPKEGVSTERPKKGKKVSQDEFDKIQEKKRKEMQEQFESRKGSKGNSGFTIEIDGGM
ncbi:GLPGLI family protein [Patiriisocius marinus]|uniref:GLPGLI family protein n=1 Tax=Patiriisocius marinus TaxID=1397112 RepID=UPI00232CC0F5|nr:GLPGLI family protein [Patiriisocius marinus]